MHLTFIPGLSDYLSAPASLPTSCKKVHFHKTFNLMQNSRHDLILYCKTNLCWSFSWNDVWYFLNSKIKIRTNNKHWHFSDVETSLMLCSQSAPVSHNVQCRITGCQRWSFLHTLTFSRIRLIASPGIFQKCLFKAGKYYFKTVRSSSFWFGLEKLGAASWTGSADWEVGNITLAFLGGINANTNSIFIIIMKIGKHYCGGIQRCTNARKVFGIFQVFHHQQIIATTSISKSLPSASSYILWFFADWYFFLQFSF